jgi:putative peptidoglycan lipid II flippase
MSQLLKSSGAMAAATMTSRLLGMVREIVYARFMGDGAVAGAFLLAFMIPNLFRRLLGEGALSAAFIPLFKEKEKTAGEAEMWRSANAVISGLIIASAIIIALALALISVALSGWEWKPETELLLQLLRIMFPYMLLVCLTAVFMGMLNARGYFFLPAMGAALLNVVMIASVFWIAPHWGATLDRQIFGLAVGVLIAGVAQAFFQLPSLLREGFRYHWVTPWGNPVVGEVVRRMIPGTIGVAAFQINVLLTMGIAFWIDPPIVASFNYAVRLMELPQGVFGLSLATFLLPTLAGLAAEKNYPEFRNLLGQGLSHIVFINVLASALLLVLAEPIMRLLFERGEFGPDATQRAAFALMCLAPGLAAFSCVNILARAFFALGDTRTPMKISIAALGFNLLLVVLFVGPLRQGGLGLANSTSAVANAALLWYALRRKMPALAFPGLGRNLLCVIGAGIAASVLAWWLHQQWELRLGHATLALKAGAVFVPATLAGLCYWKMAHALKVPSAREITGLLARALPRRL